MVNKDGSVNKDKHKNNNCKNVKKFKDLTLKDIDENNLNSPKNLLVSPGLNVAQSMTKKRFTPLQKEVSIFLKTSTNNEKFKTLIEDEPKNKE